MHTRAAKPWPFFEKILHPLENLVIILRLLFISHGGSIGTNNLAGPTLA
jgi:hypothetical protein